MLQRKRALLVIVSLSVALTGCSGVMDGGNGDDRGVPNNSTVDDSERTVPNNLGIECENGEIPQNTNVEQLLPGGNNNWQELEPEIVQVESEQGTVSVSALDYFFSQDDAVDSAAVKFGHLTGGNYTLRVSRWDSQREAGNFSGTLAIAGATSGDIRVSAMGNETKYATDLVSKVPCIADNEIKETNQFEINLSDSAPNISAPTASISSVNHQITTNGLGGYELKLDIEGQANGTGLNAVITDSQGESIGQTYIEEESLNSEVTEATIRLNTNSFGGEYTLNISQTMGEPVHNEQFSISNPTVAIESVDFEITDYDHSDTRHLNELKVTVRNDGDLTTTVDDIAVEVNGQSHSTMSRATMGPGESKTFETAILGELPKERTNVDVVVYAGDTELTRETFSV